MKILDLGCGSKKVNYPNAKVIGLDIVKHPNVDVVHDIRNLPLPFEDEEFDKVNLNLNLTEMFLANILAPEEIFFKIKKVELR